MIGQQFLLPFSHCNALSSMIEHFFEGKDRSSGFEARCQWFPVFLLSTYTFQLPLIMEMIMWTKNVLKGQNISCVVAPGHVLLRQIWHFIELYLIMAQIMRKKLEWMLSKFPEFTWSQNSGSRIRMRLHCTTCKFLISKKGNTLFNTGKVTIKSKGLEL